MGATREQGVTHDVGERISWTLRPPVSTRLDMIKLENGDEFDLPADKALPEVGEDMQGSRVKSILTWEQRRDRMKDVCSACHTDRQVDGRYKQFDNVVDLCNDKFAKPIAACMEALKAAGYSTAAPFWYSNGPGADAIEKVRKGFEERYGKGALKCGRSRPVGTRPRRARAGSRLPGKAQLAPILALLDGNPAGPR